MADRWPDPFVNLAAQDNTVDDVGDHLKRLPKKIRHASKCVEMCLDVFRCVQCRPATMCVSMQRAAI